MYVAKQSTHSQVITLFEKFFLMIYRYITVLDPDLEISWQGGGGGGVSKFFRPQFSLKIRGVGSPGPAHGSATVLS